MSELPEEEIVLLNQNCKDSNVVSSEISEKENILNDEVSFKLEIRETDISQLQDETITFKETTSNINNNKIDNIPEPNCLALTVKKNYNLTIIKNIFTKTGRMSLKVALSTLFLNFLKMFF